MRTGIATNRAGLTGLLALSGAFLAGCGHQGPRPLEIHAEELESGWSASRQVAVKVGPDGSVAWEGRAVSQDEFAVLMRQAAVGSAELLLVVVPASDQVRYGEMAEVVQMASMYGIDATISQTGGIAE